MAHRHVDCPWKADFKNRALQVSDLNELGILEIVAYEDIDQRFVLQRDELKLDLVVKASVDGEPDLMLAESLALVQDLWAQRVRQRLF